MDHQEWFVAEADPVNGEPLSRPDIMPGSYEKIALLAERVKLGVELHQAGDFGSIILGEPDPTEPPVLISKRERAQQRLNEQNRIATACRRKLKQSETSIPASAALNDQSVADLESFLRRTGKII